MKSILFPIAKHVLLLIVILVSEWRHAISQVSPDNAHKNLKALIVDGQNNHGAWPRTTAIMKDYLEQTGMFEVSIARTAFAWQGPHNDKDMHMGEEKRKTLLTHYTDGSKKKIQLVDKPIIDPDFKPDFSKYDVVISNFGWNAAAWPKETQQALENFVAAGGGLVVVHAADNSFPEWIEFNKMIGLGAWGDRSEKDGPYVYYNKQNSLVRDSTAGSAGSHGKQHEFLITVRDSTHPITRGMPERWMHVQDEMYERLRGPAQNLRVLATAFSDEVKNASSVPGTGRHEPMMMTVDYHKGRVFHTPLGHTDYSMECVGFMTLFQRSCEWAATGIVTIEIPSDFPGPDRVSMRKWNK